MGDADDLLFAALPGWEGGDDDDPTGDDWPDDMGVENPAWESWADNPLAPTDAEWEAHDEYQRSLVPVGGWNPYEGLIVCGTCHPELLAEDPS